MSTIIVRARTYMHVHMYINNIFKYNWIPSITWRSESIYNLKKEKNTYTAALAVFIK